MKLQELLKDVAVKNSTAAQAIEIKEVRYDSRAVQPGLSLIHIWFAIEYNRKLGGKKVRGSTLDKIPGVGDKRKQRRSRRDAELTACLLYTSPQRLRGRPSAPPRRQRLPRPAPSPWRCTCDRRSRSRG